MCLDFWSFKKSKNGKNNRLLYSIINVNKYYGHFLLIKNINIKYKLPTKRQIFYLKAIKSCTIHDLRKYLLLNHNIHWVYFKLFHWFYNKSKTESIPMADKINLFLDTPLIIMMINFLAKYSFSSITFCSDSISTNVFAFFFIMTKFIAFIYAFTSQ